MPIDADIAWAAGLFEGEGCFSANNPGVRNNRVRRGIIAAVTMSDLDVLQRFQEIVETGTIIRLTNDKRYPGHKPLWKWSVQKRAEVERIGAMFRPWLGARRRAKLDEVLSASWDHEPLECDYCGHQFIPQRLRTSRPTFCSRVCAKRHNAGVVTPRKQVART